MKNLFQHVLFLVSVLTSPLAQAKDVSIADYHRASLWSAVAGSESWTATTIEMIERHATELDAARDVNTFCPGYAKANRQQKNVCWLRLISGVSKLESSFKPMELYSDGIGTSVGLLAVMAGTCAAAPSVEELQNPVLNLQCGIENIAQMVQRDGVISGIGAARGAASYYSSLRAAYKSGPYSFGKKKQIIKMIDFGRIVKR